jgi:hypothetical protein
MQSDAVLMVLSPAPTCAVMPSPAAEPRESVLFIGTQFSILYTSMYSPAETATPRA